MLHLEAVPRTSLFSHKVISPFLLDAFPGPASWSELLWAKFGPLPQRHLIHTHFFFIFPTISLSFP